MPRLPLAALTAALCMASATSAWASTNGFYRQPALSGDHIYFVAEGDLWRTGVAGGPAQRLTTHPGLESQPAVSPDGRWLAFTGQYDGGTEVYVMPTAGGAPRRLTWEGGGVKVWGISAAGEVIYTGLAAHPGTQLYALDLQTGQRRQLPVAQAADGALSADGRTLYFTRNGQTRNDNARQYRGGDIARLWALELNGNTEARPFIAEGHNDRRPLPYRTANGDARVAFLSDRDGTVNLWSANTQGGDLRQHSAHKGWDIRHASIAGSRVVYALGADLHTLDLAQGDAPTRLAVTLSGDFDQTRERWVRKPQDFLTDVAFAPNGERVVLAARGHLATQGVQQLRRAELPQPADGRCRKAEFSSDSKQVFATCDFSGETEIWRFAANGTGKAEQITRGNPGGMVTQRGDLLLSPDGRWLAHTDKEGHVWLTELKTLATREIARGRFNDVPTLLGFSADGKALAWTVPLNHDDRNQLQLHQIAENRTHTLTSDRFDVSGATFSPDGQWLYFASARHFAVTGNPSPWGDRNTGPFFGSRSKLFALALQPGLRSPFAAKDELEGSTDKAADKPAEKPADKAAPEGKATDKKATDKKAEDKKDDKKAKPAIVFDGLAERLHEVPVPAGTYRALKTDGKRLWFLDTDLERKTQLKSIAIDNQGAAAETLAPDVRGYDLSADGKKLMLMRNQGQGAPEVLIVDAAPKLPAELAKHQVRWSDWQIATQPRAEWRQMFADAWRLQRDHFYDKGMHGVDWAAMRTKYEPLVDRVTDRLELAELMAQMASELGALHSQVGAGDTREAGEVPGLAGLGGRFSKVADGWRIDTIYAYDTELPSDAPPLAAPGLSLKVGDVISAVNGRATAEAPHLLELLRGQAGRQVLLDVKPAAGGKSVQRIVTPVNQMREIQLRYNDWRTSRARAVAQAGQGRIGYVHLRAMGGSDIADFVREFYAAGDRAGLIIDVRHNNGGSIDSWILEKLMRRAWAFWQPRSPGGAATYPNMQNVWRGHTVVLMNEATYSDGETFAEGFKRLQLGPVIGRQSSGAGVWLSDGNRLLDNGIMRAAEFGQIAPDGRFLIEGIGVKPDIDVDNPPRATFLGQDAQLDAAIAELKRKIAEQPVPVVKPGPYPRPVKP